MKVVVGVICICMSILFFGSGCSDEEPVKQPEKKIIVKKNIPEKPEPPPASVAVKTRPEEPEVKPQQQGVQTEQPTVTEKSEPKPETRVVEKKKPEVIKGKGIYVTKKGDSLTSIASKLDVYQDQMKWPLIYRLNIAKLKNINVDKDFPHKAIPQNTELKIITPEEAEKNLESRSNIRHVINVLSSQSEENIIINTVRLIEAGYPAYITQVNVKGQDWMRIRVGFYSRKNDADADSGKIRKLLKIPDIWVTNVGKEEFESFGKY